MFNILKDKKQYLPANNYIMYCRLGDYVVITVVYFVVFYCYLIVDLVV